MKNIFYTLMILIFVPAVVFIGGCKKNTVNGLIATRTTASTTNGNTTTTTATYTYDGQGRLTELQVTNEAPITFSYGSGTVTETQGTTTTIYTLNSSNLATSDNQGNTYVYDNNGYKITESNPGAGTSYTATISNGNIVNSSSTQNGNTTNYTYTFLSTTDYRSVGAAFLGKSNVNLVNSESISNPTTSTYNFTYTFDTKGRVQTQNVISGASSELTTYTYANP